MELRRVAGGGVKEHRQRQTAGNEAAKIEPPWAAKRLLAHENVLIPQRLISYSLCTRPPL